MKKYKNYLINLIFPAFVLGSVTGIVTSIIVSLYKLCAKWVIGLSETGYEYVRHHLYLALIIIPALFGIALLYSYIYKRVPNLRGGGIPTSIAILRGILTFKWIRNLFGIFFLSLSTFLVGVPLGNEGPSVQMGTAIGRGTVYTFAKKHRAWDRYSMTGGACAGFSVATGSPISGILFAIEDAHQRISPMIVIVSSTSVMFASITAEIISPILGVSVSLFPNIELIKLSVSDIWIPLTVGILVGLFAVCFLRYYKAVYAFFGKTLKKINSSYKIFAILTVTFVLGLCSFSFVSTGHELILGLFEGKTAIYMLALILLVRSTLTLSANSNRITGGIFVPLLALGAVLASLLGESMEAIFGLEHSYYTVILILGITACISSMMKMPLTAIVFAIEALGCYENILYVIIVSAISYIITEIFGVKSINDSVVDSRIEEMNEGKTLKVFDSYVTVEKGAFAIGKQIRDIFWPANLFVLSLKHNESAAPEVDEHGGKLIREGDILHVRYSTYDEESAKEELFAIVGNLDYDEKEIHEI